MKKILILLSIVALLMPQVSFAKGRVRDFNFTVKQETSSIYAEYQPVANSKYLFYQECLTNIECDIYQKNLVTGEVKLLIDWSGDQFPVAATERIVAFNSYDYNNPVNKYEAYYYDLLLARVMPVYEGLGNQRCEDAYGNNIIYSIGDAVPDMYVYNLKNKTSTLLVTQAIRPRIWGNRVVYIEAVGGGLANTVVYDLKTKTKTYALSLPDGYNSWPEIWRNLVVWQGLFEKPGVFYKNLKTGKEVKISEKGEAPVVSDNFISFVDYSENANGKLYTYDIVSGKTKLVAENIRHNHAEYTFDNMLYWTGYGAGGWDIFSAKFTR